MSYIRPFALAFVALLSLVLMVMFSWMGQYAHPSADDFCMAAGVQNEGLWPHLYNHYFEWSGRYLGNALYAIYPLGFGFFAGMSWMPGILIALLVFSCFYFLSRVFLTEGRNKTVWVLSVGFIALFLISLKHTASSLYWPAGALSYQSGNVLYLLLLGLMFKLYDQQKRGQNTNSTVVLLSLVAFFGVGSNETILPAFFTLILFAMLATLFWRKDWIKPWLVVLSVMSAGIAIVVLAPGNDVRLASFEHRHQLGHAIDGSLNMGFWLLKSWLSNPVLIVATLLAIFAFQALFSSTKRDFRVNGKALASVFVLTLLTPFVMQFPAWWSMGGWPPPRTVDAIYFIFLVNWFVLLATFTLCFKEKMTPFFEQLKWSKLQSIFLILLCGLLLFSIINSFKFKRLLTDMTELAEPFDQYMQARYKRIDDALEHDQKWLSVPAYRGKAPKSIYFFDIASNPVDWRNKCYADYFGLEKVRRIPMRDY